MATINKSEIIRQAIDGLDLKPNAENIPNNTDFIKPVYISNAQPRTLLFFETVTSNTWTKVVPTGKKWHVICGQVSYTTSATVGNRIVVFGLGATSSFSVPVHYGASSTAITAGNTRHQNYMNQGNTIEESGATRIIQSIPDVWITKVS